MLTVIVNAVAAEDCPNVSLTVNVKATDCFVVGVPETTPVLELSDSPSAGRPTALHVSVPVPVATNLNEYADPAVAVVTCACVVVIAGGTGLFTVIVNCTELDWGPAALESFAVAVKVTLPLAVGVPEIAPVLALIERPSAGRPVALQVIAPAPPVAANAKL